MGKGGCGSEAQRIALWMAWAIQLLATTIFFILAMIMFGAVWNCTLYLQVQVIHDAAWRGPLASLLIGGIIVFMFNLISCWILIRKSINRSGPGFGYGFIMSYAFTVAFLALLVALVLDGFQDVVDNQLTQLTGSCWTSYDTNTFIATKYFALLCFVVFLVFVAVLIILQGAVKEHLGMGKGGPNRISNPYARLGEALALNALQTPQVNPYVKSAEATALTDLEPPTSSTAPSTQPLAAQPKHLSRNSSELTAANQGNQGVVVPASLIAGPAPVVLGHKTLSLERKTAASETETVVLETVQLQDTGEPESAKA